MAPEDDAGRPAPPADAGGGEGGGSGGGNSSGDAGDRRRDPGSASPAGGGPGGGDGGSGGGEDSDGSGTRSGGARREVVVPMPIYKTVTVAATLVAVVLVVGGMVALDVATGRATRELAEINLPVATAGVLSIVLGAAAYAYSTRFRAKGMGNRKEDTDEHSDDG